MNYFINQITYSFSWSGEDVLPASEEEKSARWWRDSFIGAYVVIKEPFGILPPAAAAHHKEVLNFGWKAITVFSDAGRRYSFRAQCRILAPGGQSRMCPAGKGAALWENKTRQEPARVIKAYMIPVLSGMPAGSASSQISKESDLTTSSQKASRYS